MLYIDQTALKRKNVKSIEMQNQSPISDSAEAKVEIISPAVANDLQKVLETLSNEIEAEVEEFNRPFCVMKVLGYSAESLSNGMNSFANAVINRYGQSALGRDIVRRLLASKFGIDSPASKEKFQDTRHPDIMTSLFITKNFAHSEMMSGYGFEDPQWRFLVEVEEILMSYDHIVVEFLWEEFSAQIKEYKPRHPQVVEYFNKVILKAVKVVDDAKLAQKK